MLIYLYLICLVRMDPGRMDHLRLDVRRPWLPACRRRRIIWTVLVTREDLFRAEERADSKQGVVVWYININNNQVLVK